MITRHFRYALLSVVFIAIQTTLVRLVSIESIVPDLLVLWLVYLALKEGQLAATLWGFFIGISLDLTAGNIIGLTALSKTICGFTAGYFFDESRLKLILGSYRFLLIVFLSSLVHNCLYFIIFTRGTDIGMMQALLQYGATTTLYTTLTALFPVMIAARRSASINVE